MPVVALLASLMLPWSPTLENCGQFSKTREERATGTPLLLWETLQLRLKLSPISRHLRPSSYRL